jgi:tetratricopeptide (TPR) repeat protein
MKRTMGLLFIAASASFTIGRAQSDTAAFRAAASVKAAQERIPSLERFLSQFPRSGFSGNAWNMLFGLYAESGNEPRALDAATRYLQTVPPESRMGPYNDLAYTLAERNMGLDSALAYATAAEKLAAGEGGRSLGMVQDTRAFVLYRKGEFAAAEALQNEAIRGHEDDPVYVGHLALYQESNGKRRPALSTIARAIYLGGDRELESRFLDWLSHEEKDAKRREELRSSIVMGTVHSVLDTLRGERAIAAGSRAAAFMAELSVDLPAAQAYAEAAVASLTNTSPVEDAVTFRQNLAIVTAACGKFKEALAMLRSVEDLASPWSTDFWFALGGVYQRLGQQDSAVVAYMNGLTVVNTKELRDTLEAVYRKLHGSADRLDSDLERLKQSGAVFDPGRYAPSGGVTGKVVLAELFTGAECSPCVAADRAFDALWEYYPRTALAILEYHVHIPGADPLTTNDSWSRYQFYRVRGTPTAVIDGRESIVGGGPKYIARSRFNLYTYAIGKYQRYEPGMHLGIDASGQGDSITITVHVGETGAKPKAGNCLLHVALVERTVDYTGGNGISRHSMVVRKLIGGASGRPLSRPFQQETVRLSASLKEIESGISDVIRDPKGQTSWPGPKRPFSGWKSLPRTINRSNLSVVAWVQDKETNEVYQSAFVDVPSVSGGH